MMSAVREPHRLPVVLSREEVARLLAALHGKAQLPRITVSSCS